MAQIHDIVDADCGGYIVPIQYGARRMEAARALIEERYGGERHEQDPSRVISVARTAHRKPRPYFRHDSNDELEDLGCGCEEPGWICTMAMGAKEFDAWFFDCSWVSLKECFTESGQT